MLNRRGAIRHRDRAKQLRDYTGLRYGKITPTDIDGVIEYHDEAYFFIEVKKDGVKMPYGQRLAFERITDDLEKAGKPTVYVIASHQVHNCKDDIDVANTLVIKYRFKRTWHSVDPRLGITIRKMADMFFNDTTIKSFSFPPLSIQQSKFKKEGDLITF